MKNLPQIITKFIIVILLSNFLFSCATSYRYKPNVSKLKYIRMTSSPWERLDKNNYLILHVHSKDQMKELYNVNFNSENKLISGKLRPFEGAPLRAFNNVTDVGKKENLRVKNDEIPKKATKQVHFYLSSDYDLTKDDITFSLADVYIVSKSRSKLSTGARILVSIGVVSAAMMGSLLLYVVILL